MRPRIRTLKPELWADERVGDLSHGARLLFVGLITMADDEGRLRELPAAILGHVFPYDDVTSTKLSRWLREVETSQMVVRYETAGKRYIAFRHWTRHQRVDKPQESQLPAPADPELVAANQVEKYDASGNFKKTVIPERVRRAVARKAGAVPGEQTIASCHWCSAHGSISWPRLDDGRPGSWVRFVGLELDHVIPEFAGGLTDEENLVLACQTCNRVRGHRRGDQPPASRTGSRRSVIHDHGEITETPLRTRASDPVLSDPDPVSSKSEDARALFDYWCSRCQHEQARPTQERMEKIRARLAEGYTVEQIHQAIDGAARAAFVNDAGKRFDDIELICRNGSKLESFIDRATAKPVVPRAATNELDAKRLASMNRLMNTGDVA